MNNEDLSRVAKFYGLEEEEILRRYGGLLESNLQAFKDAMQDAVIRKISENPNQIKQEFKLLLKLIDDSKISAD